MQNLQWRQIEIFHAVMTSGTLTQAAALLHTSQPTLSRELARLEHQLAIRLFTRTQGRLQPTRQAMTLFEEVQCSWYGLQRIQQTAVGLRHFQQAELSIVCLPAFSQSLLPRLCQPFLACYPELSMTITPQESPLLEEWLSAQRFDLGLTETLQAPTGTTQLTLIKIDEVCVLPQNHPLAKKSQLALADFANESFINLSATDNYRLLLDNLFQQQGIKRRCRVETHNAASVCALVAAGAGISIVNPFTALDYLSQGVVMRRLAISVPFIVSLITPQHRLRSATTEAFCQHIQAQIGLLKSKVMAGLDLDH